MLLGTLAESRDFLPLLRWLIIVSLTGFGDWWPARLSSVDLTTARQDPEKMGIAAIQAAIRRIDQPALPPSVSVVEPWLVVRGSTSRPPGG